MLERVNEAQRIATRELKDQGQSKGKGKKRRRDEGGSAQEEDDY